MPKLVFGLLAPRCTGDQRKHWNKSFLDERLDAFFDFYRTETKDELILRLSEMFHLERRGYLVSSVLSPYLPPLLDSVDESASKGSINVILNDGGLLRGFCVEGEGEEFSDAVLRIWLHR